MKLKKLKLRNFRNLDGFEIGLNPRLNILFGSNGSGKTNFCEALHFTSTGEMLKGRNQAELVGWKRGYALIKFTLVNDDEVLVYLEKNGGKELRVNSKESRQMDVRSLVTTYTFIPEDLNISKGPPRRRRELLNEQIGLLVNDYPDLLSRYRAQLKKKNALLKKEKINEEFLSVLNERLAELGAQIVIERLNYLEQLNEKLPELYGLFVRNESRLSLNYENERAQEGSLDSLKDWFEKELEANRSRELEKDTSIIGPHRDKFKYRLNGKDLRKYGSQGELRTAVIATYLAYLDLHEETFDCWPVLILDDILSELDRSRGEVFLENLPSGPQMFLTTATRNKAFKKLSGEFSVWTVKEGEVSQP